MSNVFLCMKRRYDDDDDCWSLFDRAMYIYIYIFIYSEEFISPGCLGAEFCFTRASNDMCASPRSMQDSGGSPA